VLTLEEEARLLPELFASDPLEGLDFLDRTMLFICKLERMCCIITTKEILLPAIAV